MSTKLLTKSSEVIDNLKEGGDSEKTIRQHRRCFEELRKYVSRQNAPFSMELALNWLERHKQSWSYDCEFFIVLYYKPLSVFGFGGRPRLRLGFLREV